MFEDNNEVDELFGSGPAGPATLKEQNIGDVIGGIVFKVERLEERDDNNQVKLNDRGKPKPLLVTWVITDLRDPNNPDDDGARRIWWKGKGLWELQQFQRANGFGAPKPGGGIWRKYTGTQPSGRPKPLNLYAAKYEAPTLENEKLAYEYAQRWNAKKPPAQDEWFGSSGPVSSPPAQHAQATTLDSMRSGFGGNAFTDEPPF